MKPIIKYKEKGCLYQTFGEDFTECYKRVIIKNLDSNKLTKVIYFDKHTGETFFIRDRIYNKPIPHYIDGRVIKKLNRKHA